MNRRSCVLYLAAATTLALPSRIPLAPPTAPTAGNVTTVSLELTWARGDDSTLSDPTDWFELQQRALGEPETSWRTVAAGARVGAPTEAWPEGPHSAQVISIRVDRGQRVQGGYFQLALSIGGDTYLDRATPGDRANNHTALITAPIQWDATAAQV